METGSAAPLPPHPVADDFFERAWGWDSLLPKDMVTPLSLYKIYLRQYYIRNHQMEANAAGADDIGLNGDDHGNGMLAALADSCIKMENSLKHVWECRAESFTIDVDETEVLLVSDNITKRAHEMAQIRGSEFPAAAVALKCITKEAELMCQCIISGDSVMSFSLSNSLRQCALILMTCKDYVPAAAAMMGVMKEAESAIGLLRADQDENNAKIACTDFVRHRTLLVMFELCDECSAVAEPTVSDITGDLNSNELDNKLADNGNHEERGNVSENKKSKKELARKDGSNRTDENQNPNEKLGRSSLEKDEVKPDTKACAEKQVDLVGSSNEGYCSASKKNVGISKTDEKNFKKELAGNDMDDSNMTDENQNPNEKLGRNSLEKGVGKPDKLLTAKAGTEEQVNQVGSSNEDGSASKEKKLFGKAGGPKKWILGCFTK